VARGGDGEKRAILGELAAVSASLVADDSDAAVAYTDDAPLSSDARSAPTSNRLGDAKGAAAAAARPVGGDTYDAAIV